ncbi:Gfo/Idh/MocA family protein [Afifella pfennigii]|uniref:Gfo/Idh/MocA family protein n=1 Tax=Afifella pfennigii TaxID=209897 RepID=UPI00047EDE4F|nr:Gfo/Idh/MocA family oxidoreductase [Afifella pfennigii]
MHQTSELRAAVIGLGKLGLLHAATLHALPGCRLVAVADKAKTVLNGLKARTTGIEVFTDFEKLLDQIEPDVVAIATPTGLHVPVALECIRRDRHVFIEKPLSTDAAQAEPLLSELTAHPVVNMVGYMTRFQHTAVKAREIIASGALGRLQMLRSSMYIGQLFKRGKGWRYDPKVSGGGVLTTQNSHLIDLLRHFFGPIDWVSAQMGRLYSQQVEDHAHVFLQFENGLRGFLDASWSARHYRTPTVAIHVQGENGTLDVDDDQVQLFLVDGVGSLAAGWHRWRKPDLYKGVPFDIGGTIYTDQAMEFLGAVRGEGEVGSDIRSAFEVQRVIDAAYLSAEGNGVPVSLKEGHTNVR